MEKAGRPTRSEMKVTHRIRQGWLRRPSFLLSLQLGRKIHAFIRDSAVPDSIGFDVREFELSFISRETMKHLSSSVLHIPRSSFICVSVFERVAAAQIGPHFEQMKTNTT